MERPAHDAALAAVDWRTARSSSRRTTAKSRLPLEDVAYVVLDTPQVTLSTTLLSACMDAGIVISSPTERTRPAV